MSDESDFGRFKRQCSKDEEHDRRSSSKRDLEIEALYDGEIVGAKEPVMLIKGDLSIFVHLETVYLGALTDGTMVATNTRDVVEAANGKPVLMFGARHQAAESQSAHSRLTVGS